MNKSEKAKEIAEKTINELTRIITPPAELIGKTLFIPWRALRVKFVRQILREAGLDETLAQTAWFALEREDQIKIRKALNKVLKGKNFDFTDK